MEAEAAEAAEVAAELTVANRRRRIPLEDVPSLKALSANVSWIPYRRGLGHSSDDPSWGGAPLHGLALPTSNSLVGSLIADENVLAVRDITMPPFTGGPWSSVARNTSTLGRLSIHGSAIYTEAYKWTAYGFERRATASDGTSVHTSVRTPLDSAGVLMSAKVAAGGPLDVQLHPQIRAYPASEVNCTERQWRYPSNIDSALCLDGVGYCARNCWCVKRPWPP